MIKYRCQHNIRGTIIYEIEKECWKIPNDGKGTICIASNKSNVNTMNQSKRKTIQFQVYNPLRVDMF